MIARIESGTSVNAADVPASPGEIAVLKTSCVYSGEFAPSENKTVFDPVEMARVACPLRPKTVIVSRMNTPDLVGAAAYVGVSVDGVFLPDRLWQITFNADVEPRWVHYWTKVPSYRDQLRAICVGTSSSMQNISQADFGSLVLALPSRQEQKRIADFLDRETANIGELIAKQEQLIATLREDRTATITHAVTKGLDPDVEMKDSGAEWLGDIPRHWRMSRFSRHIAINSGQVDPRLPVYAEISLIAPNHVDSGTGLLLSLETASEQGADSGKYLVAKGQVIYSKIRPNLAKVVIAPCNTLCSADMYGLQADPKLIKPDFLLYLLLSKPFTDYVIDSSLRVAMPKVNHDSLGAAPVWIPPVSEQREICAFLQHRISKLDALMSKSNEVIEALREYRSALTTDAVTGKIDVRGAA